MRALDAVLHRIARTRLIGVSEAERRKFDYSAVLLRDFSRPLVSQVLWSHVEGVEKDVRTLLHDREALIVRLRQWRMTSGISEDKIRRDNSELNMLKKSA